MQSLSRLVGKGSKGQAFEFDAIIVFLRDLTDTSVNMEKLQAVTGSASVIVESPTI